MIILFEENKSGQILGISIYNINYNNFYKK